MGAFRFKHYAHVAQKSVPNHQPAEQQHCIVTPTSAFLERIDMA
nr:unnamed protein product [Callosobruchus analis]